jgi:hypothetical protein
MADQVVLTIPDAPGFDRIAHLVVSGLAVRLNLTVENIEDLQTALDALIDGHGGDGELTVALSLENDELETRVGPLDHWLLDEIEREDAGDELGVRRVLDSTVDDVLVDGSWVRLTKKVTIVDG